MNNAGVGAGDCVEQVNYLLFLKLDAERAEDGASSWVKASCQWGRAPLHGGELARTYAAALETRRPTRSCRHHLCRIRNGIEEPARLRRLFCLIDAETWSAFGPNVKGAIYEGPLERTASDVETGLSNTSRPSSPPVWRWWTRAAP